MATRKDKRRKQLKSEKLVIDKDIFNRRIAVEVDRQIQIVEQQTKKASIEAFMGAIILSLHDEFAWFSNDKHGSKRLNRFLDRFNNQFECISKGTVSVDDFNKFCMDKGINYMIEQHEIAKITIDTLLKE